MTTKQLETKVKELERRVAVMEHMGKQLTELIISTLEQYKCKTCRLYHFPEPLKNCLRRE